MGIKEKSGRYQMRAEALLPKFISDKNPFAAPPAPEPAPAAAVQSPTVERPDPAPAKAEPPKPASLSKPSRPSASVHNPSNPGRPAPTTTPRRGQGKAAAKAGAPANLMLSAEAKRAQSPAAARVAPTRVEPQTTRPAAPAVKPHRPPLGAWVGKLNPLAYLPSKGPGAKPGRSERPPVQAELSLERVKVVRNDLSEADLEVVPARPRPAEPGPLRVLQPAAVQMPTAWNRISSRFFGAEHTTPTQ
jgi:hypothetical protein